LRFIRREHRRQKTIDALIAHGREPFGSRRFALWPWLHPAALHHELPQPLGVIAAGELVHKHFGKDKEFTLPLCGRPPKASTIVHGPRTVGREGARAVTPKAGLSLRIVPCPLAPVTRGRFLRVPGMEAGFAVPLKEALHLAKGARLVGIGEHAALGEPI